MVTYDSTVPQLNYATPMTMPINLEDTILYCRPLGNLQQGAFQEQLGTLCDYLYLQVDTGGILGWTVKDRLSIYNTDAVSLTIVPQLIAFDTTASNPVLNCQLNWNNLTSIYLASQSSLYNVVVTVNVYLQALFVTTQLCTLLLVVDNGPTTVVASQTVGVVASAVVPNTNIVSVTLNWTGQLNPGDTIYVQASPDLTPSPDFFYSARMLTITEL